MYRRVRSCNVLDIGIGIANVVFHGYARRGPRPIGNGVNIFVSRTAGVYGVVHSTAGRDIIRHEGGSAAQDVANPASCSSNEAASIEQTVARGALVGPVGSCSRAPVSKDVGHAATSG